MESKSYEFGAFVLTLNESSLVLENTTKDISVEWRFDGNNHGTAYNLCKMLDESNGDGEWNEPVLAKEYLKLYFACLWNALTTLPDGEFFADWAKALGAFYERHGSSEVKEDITEQEYEELLSIEHGKQELLDNPDRLIDDALAEFEENKKKGII